MIPQNPIPSLEQEAPWSYASPPAGYLLHKVSLIVLSTLLILAAWGNHVGIVIFLGIVLCASGLSGLWSRASLRRVYCARLIRERRLFPGEATELTLQVTNRKLLPLPWLQIEDEIPVALAGDNETVLSTRPAYCLLSYCVSLLWYRRAKWRRRLLAQKRGYYPLGPVYLTAGDIFGFYPRWAKVPLHDHVLVYPKIYHLQALGLPSQHPLGDSKTARRIFQDPTRTIGLRDYRPGDSLRYIHWKASARQQYLQVKVFEPTTDLKTALFLAVDTFQDGGTGEEEFELAISIAASVAKNLIDRSSAVGMFGNTRLADSGSPISIPPAGNRSQLMLILEALAKVTPGISDPFEKFVQEERRNLPYGMTLIFLVFNPLGSLLDLLNDLKESGYKILLLLIGQRQDRFVPEFIPHCIIRHPEQLEGVKP